ncbi:NAD(P)H-binding protein [Streptomyces sp. NPDC127119]|uniref:NAD(P)H-binding protein n=1 Tax=Streptomyces sp. NPDC127119 TaxID=3345370 RepID=UPI003637BE3D
MERGNEHGPLLVIGSTGKTGRRVLEELQRLGESVRALARSTPTPFDWFDESTWEEAVSGARGAYLVDAQDEHAAERMRAFASYAVKRNVKRLVLLSARGWATSQEPELLATEEALKESGAAWTILRPTWFMQGFTEDRTLREPVLAGELRLPCGDGTTPFIDAEDIAEVAAAVLTRDGHEGRTYALSGPRAVGMREAADTIAGATGRPVRYVPISEESYVAGLIAQDVPPEQARFVAKLFGWLREGEDAHLSDGVQQVLGRTPRDFPEFVTRAADAGAWGP